MRNIFAHFFWLLLRNIIPEVIYPNLCDKQKNILSILHQQHNKLIRTHPIILAIINIMPICKVKINI